MVKFSGAEQIYILDHEADGPGRIAWKLGKEYPEDNGGSRDARAVRSFLYRQRRPYPLRVMVPAAVIKAAESQGVTKEELAIQCNRYLNKLYPPVDPD